MTKIKILIFLIPILLILIFWKDTLFHLSDRLYDWNDAVYFIWLIQNHIHNLTSLNFSHLFDATAMYPFKFALSFGEQFFFPSLIALLISPFNQNPIFQLNLLLVANHILNFICFYVLSSLFIRNFWSRLISSFYISFSPYFFSQLGHFQMIFFWPFLLSLYFLIKDKISIGKSKKNLLFAGIFLGIQFMSSIYLGIMGFTIIFLYFAVRLYFGSKPFYLSKKFLILLVIFLLTAGISIYGYMLAKNEYGGRRDIGEYIYYSAHLSDYVFLSGNQSAVLYGNGLIGRWNSFNHHNSGERAAFIGIIPLIIIFAYLFKFTRNKTSSNISIHLNEFTFFLIMVGLTGFIFSLGPRLNVNGTYLHIPLPYYLVFKEIPFIDVLRALARWSFLVALATAILVGLGLDKLFENLTKKISQRSGFLIGFFVFGLFIIEFYPKPLPVTSKIWWDKSYEYMNNNLCTNKPAILEYPFIYRNSDGNIIKDLQYKMVILLASTKHSCKILSGFSGYEPPEYIKIKEQLDNNGIDINDINLLRKLGFTYIKLNKFALFNEESVSLPKDLEELGLKAVYRDNVVDIYSI